MREDFEDAFYLFCDTLEAIRDVIKLIMRCIIFITLPIWIIPYAIRRKVREGKDNA